MNELGRRQDLGEFRSTAETTQVSRLSNLVPTDEEFTALETGPGSLDIPIPSFATAGSRRVFIFS